MKKAIVLLSAVLAISFTGCSSDASVASANLTRQADMFELERRIVFYNGITGEYMLTITGRSSVDVSMGRLAVTVKTGPTEFKKHYLGLSDNITYFSEQLEASEVSTYRYEVIFKPASIAPTINLVK